MLLKLLRGALRGVTFGEEGMGADGRRVEAVAIGARRRGNLLRVDPYIDDHLVMEVLIPGDQGIALVIFEADTHGDVLPRIETIEVLHRRYDGVRGIMGVDVDTKGQARRSEE